MRSFALLGAGLISALTISTTAAHADSFDQKRPLLKGATTASYFWDDSSGRAGDTGLPASGKPMQKGLVASPSWPLFTEGYVIYKGKKAPFFVGDRGPGTPSSSGVMLDLDAKTFAHLTGGKFNSSTLGVDGVGGEGHIKVSYVITKWGGGAGKKNYPVSFSTGAWARMDHNPAKPPKIVLPQAPKPKPAPKQPDAPAQAALPAKPSQDKPAPLNAAVAAAAAAQPVNESNGVGGFAIAGGLAILGGGLVLGQDKLRKLVRR
ncbi:hypothetical protein ACIBHX_17880 [Nonomuraea sp. NPDC050536]|uniref:hypothetical protein n=1 Tax=Nonomuraea sp. NPDC050536 TaxID=3364366 RepID=UPI0037CB6D2D